MNEDLLRQIVERSSYFIAAVDSAMTFTVANNVCRDEVMYIYGRTLSVGNNLRDILAAYPVQLAQLEGLIGRALAGEAVQTTMVLAGSNQHHRRYRIAISPLHEGVGLAVGALIEAQRAEAELPAALAEARQQLRQAELQAERSVQAKTRFFAALSHDLRQPAQALTLLSYMLHERAVGTPAADLVRPIDEAVTALRLVLEGVLDLSRLDTGVVEVQDEPLVVGALLSRLAGEFGPRAAHKGLAFRWVRSTATVKTDIGLLEHILRQLLENALRFTGRGRILLGCRNRGGRLAIEVLDTGVGIPEGEHDAIFEDFYQIGNPARDRRLGLGVGLAVARRLAGLIGARISLTSTPGRGSCFAVELAKNRLPPAELAEDEAAYTVSPVVAPAAVALVVEDDESVRASLCMLLESFGYQVVTAASGEEAAGMVGDGLSPSFVLADYRLQRRMNGVQAIDAIRRRIGKAVPALLVTGNVGRARRNEFDQQGLPVLYKPVAADDLMHAVARLSAAN